MGCNKNEDMTKGCYSENEDILNLKSEVEKIHRKIKDIYLVEDINIREDILEVSRKLDRVINKHRNI